MAVEKDFELMKLEYQFYADKADLHYRAVEATMRLYFILVAGFMSLIAYVYQDDFAALEINKMNVLMLGIISVLFIIGLTTFFKVAEHRLLLLSYIRSLNGVRSWFIDNCNLDEKYFLFKPDKSQPLYFRRFRHFYWELMGIALINSIWALVLSYNLFPKLKVHWFVLLSIVMIVLQMLYYRIRAYRKDKEEQD